MANKINFSDYTASGVYFLEIDNSIITTSSSRTALRMAVGFNMRGPFNRPVYVSGVNDCNKFFGPIDKKLERQGCFTNRMVRTMLRKSPVYVLNLLNVSESRDQVTGKCQDSVGCSFLPFRTNDCSVFDTPYADLYDKTKFWITDDKSFVDNAFVDALSYEYDMETELKKAPFYAFGNCGTKDISIIVKKSEDNGYNVTFLEYYGSKEEIPYKWINPNDYVSDYFVDVIVVSGLWNDSGALSKDVVWGSYFDEKGLKANMLNKFIRLDAVNVIAQFTGCVIPGFQDKQGTIKSIDYAINSKCNETGLMFGVNEDAMEYVALDGSRWFYDETGLGEIGEEEVEDAKFVPDFVGNDIDASTNEFTYLSSVVNPTDMIKSYPTLGDSYTIGDDTSVTLGDNQFMVSEEDAKNIKIGDFVVSESELLAKIIKKRVVKGEGAVYTASSPIKVNSSSTTITEPAVDENGEPIVDDATGEPIVNETTVTTNTVEIHPTIQSMTTHYSFINLKGLKLSVRHMPGYDENGSPNKEAGVEKIYKMLENSGIRKGLLNDDAIDFRYIIDTMAYGLKENCGGKKYLAAFAKEKGHCTALINAPSMAHFASSDEPFFGEDPTKACFDVAYIAQGGNQDLPYSSDTESFSLPGDDFGSDHVGVFAPFIKYAEKGKVILVPPAADVSNTFMNKFTGGDPYVTIANRNGIINNNEIVGVEYQFDEEDRGHLESMGINPIIDRAGQYLIYGDKTAYQTFNSDLSYLHVRELLNTIQLSCKSVLDDYVFTYNIPTTRAEIVTRLNPILRSMKDSGALVKYEIQCDDVNNDKEVIDNKFCIVDIGVWISQNMEKIVVPITINRSTTA